LTDGATRREFLGAAAFGPVAAKVFGEPAKFPTRAFGRTGAQVPIVAFGAGTRFLAYEDEDQALAVLSRAIELGINYVDTAHSYGGGKSEERVGRLMPTRRQDVFLATKLGARKGDEARRQLELSLKRLKTDRLDVLHIHSLESLEDLAAIEAPDGVLKAVLQARDQKVTRFVGITGHADPVAMKAALERHDFDCVQMALNVARARMSFDDQGPHPIPMGESSYEALALPVASAKKMGVIAMKVFGQDRLLGQAPAEKLLYYALSLPVSLASVGMPKPELLERNAGLARSFAPLPEAEMQQLRASVAEPQRTALARFFQHHRDV
jgi:aryl-alcohol dehydrogenase-like predicted oxidoreductase